MMLEHSINKLMYFYNKLHEELQNNLIFKISRFQLSITWVEQPDHGVADQAGADARDDCGGGEHGGAGQSKAEGSEWQGNRNESDTLVRGQSQPDQRF